MNAYSNGVPSRAVLVSVLLLLIGVALNYLAPTEVFTWLSAISAFSSIWTWGVILLAQINFRKSLSKRELAGMTLRVPFFPYASYLAGLFLLAVLVVMAFHSETQIALIVGPAWITLLIVLYYMRGCGRASTEVRTKEAPSR